MATAERPQSRINGKPNPAYTAWRKENAPRAKFTKRDGPAPTKAQIDAIKEALTVRGLKTLPNPAWVLATHPLEPGNTIEVEVRRGQAKQFVNKDFPVTLNTDGTAKHADAV